MTDPREDAGHETTAATDEGHAAAETAPSSPAHSARTSKRRGRRSAGGFFAELPVLVLVAFVLAILLKTFLLQAFYIPSESMIPTLAVGDRVLVNKLAHEFRDPVRGEVVVFSQGDESPAQQSSESPVLRTFQSLASGLGFAQEGEKDFIKRIIGLPGETIEMRDGVVYADGVAVPEVTSDRGGYLSRPDLADFGPTKVPEGQYFLMGDNRPNSSDSRSVLGTIDEEDLIGRAFVIVWPPDRLTALSLPAYDRSAAGGD